MFLWAEVGAYVYFVFVSAVPSIKVAEWLREVGFRGEISERFAAFIYSIWTIVVAALVFLISRYTSRLRSQNADALKEQLEDERSQNARMSETLSSLTPSLRSFFGFTLESMLRKIKLDESPKVRISAYILPSDKEHFMPVGRFSHNAEYRAQGRTLLPFSEGCIAEAWRTGTCEWREMSKTIDVRRKKALQQYQIREETSSGLRMPAVALGAYRIDDNSKAPVGLILIEAEDMGS